MKLAKFILTHMEEILAQWEAFARSLSPAAGMSRKELRNDAERMLRFIAADTTTLGADEDEVMLSVHNRGNAIPGEAWNDIFMPLRRGREAGDKSVGLGLCIVRQIARAPGGDVVVNYSGARGPEFSGRLSRSR